MLGGRRRTGAAPAAWPRRVDIVFAAAVLVLAAANPGGADAGVRWVMAGLGDVVAVVGAVKLWCARERGAASSPARLSA